MEHCFHVKSFALYKYLIIIIIIIINIMRRRQRAASLCQTRRTFNKRRPSPGTQSLAGNNQQLVTCTESIATQRQLDHGQRVSATTHNATTTAGSRSGVQRVSVEALGGCVCVCVYKYIYIFIVQELCESRGGRPELSVLTSLLVSVHVKLC